MTRRRWTLIAVVLGSAAVFLDSTVVNVALPRIGRELPTHYVAVLEGQSYVYNAYLLTLSTLLIPAGALGDHYGRRKIFALGLGAFALTSLFCGLAPNMELLIVARILQGGAGALLVPGSLALIRANFEGEEQGRAIGTWAAASSATTLLGPLVAGLLVDTLSWRVAFLINLPVLALAAWALLRHTPESRDESAAGHLDWLGAAISGLAVGGLSFGAIYGQQREWRGAAEYVALAIGAVALIALPFELARSKAPLVPPSLFKSRDFTVVNVVTFVVYGALYVSGYYQALFLQGVLGYSAAAAGTSAIPGSLLLAIFSARVGAVAVRIGVRKFMAAGAAVMAAGVLWLARTPVTSGAWRLDPGHPTTWPPPLGYLTDILPASLLFGVGLALLVAPLTSALMASVPANNAGVASAVNNAISRVGPQLAGALVFIAVTALFRARVGDVGASPLNPPPPGVGAAARAAINAASTDAFHVASIACAVLLLAGALVAWTGLRDRPSPA
jgi:EmrB/QacA subfamily drug resistance transporter